MSEDDEWMNTPLCAPRASEPAIKRRRTATGALNISFEPEEAGQAERAEPPRKRRAPRPRVTPADPRACGCVGQHLTGLQRHYGSGPGQGTESVSRTQHTIAQCCHVKTGPRAGELNSVTLQNGLVYRWQPKANAFVEASSWMSWRYATTYRLGGL